MKKFLFALVVIAFVAWGYKTADKAAHEGGIIDGLFAVIAFVIFGACWYGVIAPTDEKKPEE